MKLSRCAFALLLGASLMAASLPAQERRGKGSETPVRRVEMFQAIEDGELEVKLVAKNSRQVSVLFDNKTDELLEIKLPEAFAGVPVLKQGIAGGGGLGGLGGGGGLGGFGGGGGLGGGGFGGGGQGFGGGFGGGGGGFGGGGGLGGLGGGGFGGGGFGGLQRVRPDKIGRVKVPCVCLEHGKPDPTSRMTYKIVPLESFTQDAATAEICKMLARGEIPQNTAQAAVWRTANHLSWQELAAKNRVKLLNGYTEKYFTRQELLFASRVVNVAAQRAKQASQRTPASPGEIGDTESN